MDKDEYKKECQKCHVPYVEQEYCITLDMDPPIHQIPFVCPKCGDEQYLILQDSEC